MQFLVLTKDRPGVDWAEKSEVLRQEAEAIVGLTSQGVARNLWFTRDKDAVLLFEEESRERVEAALKTLPLVQNRLIDYEIMELFPYTGFERLRDDRDR
jgi:muconolactone delta-isomerase